MKKLSNLILIALAAFMFSSCEKVVGEGPVVKEERAISNFKGISVGIGGKVYYKIDPVFKVELHAQRNILDIIQTNLNGDELNIKFKDGTNVRSRSEISIYISAPSAEWINLSGSAEVELTGNAQAANMNLRVSGSGNIHVQRATLTDKMTATISGSGNILVDNGSCVNQTLKISGSGKIDMADFVSQNIDAEMSGSGNMYVHAQQKLKAHVSGSGSVLYRGTPVVDASVSGSGRVRPL